MKHEHTLRLPIVLPVIDGITRWRKADAVPAERRGVLNFMENLFAKPETGWLKTPLRGSLAGLVSGVHAVKTRPVAKYWTTKSTLLTIGGYVLGGLVAALIYRGVRRTSLAPQPELAL